MNDQGTPVQQRPFDTCEIELLEGLITHQTRVSLAEEAEVERRLRAFINGDDAKPNRNRQRRRIIWALPAGAASLLAAIAITIALSVGTDLQHGQVRLTSARAALTEAAINAAKQPPQPLLSPGDYFYSRKDYSYTLKQSWGRDKVERRWTQSEKFSIESWVNARGKTHSRESGGGPDALEFPTARDRKQWELAGKPYARMIPIAPPGPGRSQKKTKEHAFSVGNTWFSYEDLQNLPTETGKLDRAISRYARRTKQWQMTRPGKPTSDAKLYVLTSILDMPISNELRSALYKVAAGLPGIKQAKNTVDQSGRSGVAITFDTSVARTVLIFDPATGQDLERQTIWPAPNSGSGEPGDSRFRYETIKQRGVVDSRNGVPPAN